MAHVSYLHLKHDLAFNLHHHIVMLLYCQTDFSEKNRKYASLLPTSVFPRATNTRQSRSYLFVDLALVLRSWKRVVVVVVVVLWRIIARQMLSSPWSGDDSCETDEWLNITYGNGSGRSPSRERFHTDSPLRATQIELLCPPPPLPPGYILLNYAFQSIYYNNGNDMKVRRKDNRNHRSELPRHWQDLSRLT